MGTHYKWEQVIADNFFAHDRTIIEDENLTQNQEFINAAEQLLAKVSSCTEEDIETLRTQIKKSNRSPVIIAGNLNKILTLLDSIKGKVLPNIRLYRDNPQAREQLCSVYNAAFEVLEETISKKQGIDDRKIRDAQSRFDDAKESQEVVNRVNKAVTQSDEAKNKVDSLLPNLITILGIFVAIIIAVVAVYLSAIFAQQKFAAHMTVFHTVVTCILLGQILINFIFFFIFLLSRLTNFTLAGYCTYGKCTDCSRCEKGEMCHWGNKLWFRYPYAVLFNSICLIAYISLGIWRIVSEYIGEEIDALFKKNVLSTLGLSGGLIILAILLLYGAFRFLTRKKEDKDAKKTEKEWKKAEQVRKEAEQARDAATRARKEADQARKEANQARKEADRMLERVKKKAGEPEKEPVNTK